MPLNIWISTPTEPESVSTPPKRCSKKQSTIAHQYKKSSTLLKSHLLNPIIGLTGPLWWQMFISCTPIVLSVGRFRPLQFTSAVPSSSQQFGTVCSGPVNASPDWWLIHQRNSELPPNSIHRSGRHQFLSPDWSSLPICELTHHSPTMTPRGTSTTSSDIRCCEKCLDRSLCLWSVLLSVWNFWFRAKHCCQFATRNYLAPALRHFGVWVF